MSGFGPNFNAAFAGPQKPTNRMQTPKAQINARIGPSKNKFLGGGGMAVGSLRSKRGTAIHPKQASDPRLTRLALTSGMKG